MRPGYGCTGKAIRHGSHHRTEIGGKGEERSRHRLCQPIAYQECLVSDPSGCNNLRLKQRQHDMAAAKDERPRPVERVEQGEPLGASHRNDERRDQEKRREETERDDPSSPGNREI